MFILLQPDISLSGGKIRISFLKPASPFFCVTHVVWFSLLYLNLFLPRRLICGFNGLMFVSIWKKKIERKQHNKNSVCWSYSTPILWDWRRLIYSRFLKNKYFAGIWMENTSREYGCLLINTWNIAENNTLSAMIHNKEITK